MLEDASWPSVAPGAPRGAVGTLLAPHGSWSMSLAAVPTTVQAPTRESRPGHWAALGGSPGTGGGGGSPEAGRVWVHAGLWALGGVGGRPCPESLSIRGARGWAALSPCPRACGTLLCVWLFFQLVERIDCLNGCVKPKKTLFFLNAKRLLNVSQIIFDFFLASWRKWWLYPSEGTCLAWPGGAGGDGAQEAGPGSMGLRPLLGRSLHSR